MNEYQENQIKRIKATFRAIREYQVTILIFFIIVSILYGIHMFRYEFIVKDSPLHYILRYDRITNSSCILTESGLNRPQVNYNYSVEDRVDIEDCKPEN